MFAIKSLCTFLVLTRLTGLVSGWQPLGSTIIPDSLLSNTTGLAGSNTVDVSEDGKRLAVGVPAADDGTGAVFVYELMVEDDPTMATSWKLLVTLHGITAEGLGDIVSLSSDGHLVAVRRHLPTNHVQVYHIAPNDEAYVLEKVGADKKCPGSSYGQSVTLGQASSPSLSPSSMDGKYFLVYGCESYDNGRGKVHVYHLLQDGNNAAYTWAPFVSHLNGSQDGEGFGSATSFVHAPSVLSPTGRVVRLAISSPGYNNGKGRVQVLSTTIGSDDWERQGTDLNGSLVGEAFGTALDMSTGEYPYVAVGSPLYNHADASQGMVYLYHWRSPAFGVSPLWQLVDSVYKQDGSEFGRSVSISSNGNRLAASSQNLAALYELQDYYNLKLVSDLILSPANAVNTTIALNGPASILAATSSSGEVQVVMDDSAFCKIPLSGAAPTIETFLERTTCRANGIDLVSTEEQCQNTAVYMNGMRACEWIPPYDTPAPSLSPSMHPSDTPSGNPSTDMPTLSPSLAPSLTLSNTLPPNSDPTPAPSPQHTLTPSLALSSPPTTSSTTREPSLLPGTNRPSASPPFPTTWEPSIGPSISPTTDSYSLESPSSGPSMIETEIEDPMSSPSNDDFEPLTACRCNETFACTTARLEENAEVLRICINKHSSDFVIVDLEHLKLVHGNLTTPMVENGDVKVDNVTVQCNQGSCQIQIPVNADLFANDRPPYLAASGQVEVTSERRNLRSRRNLAELLRFGTIVLLEQATLATGSTVEKDIKKSTQSGMGPLMWLIVALIVVLVALVAGRAYLKLKRPQ